MRADESVTVGGEVFHKVRCSAKVDTCCSVLKNASSRLWEHGVQGEVSRACAQERGAELLSCKWVIENSPSTQPNSAVRPFPSQCGLGAESPM